MGVECTNGKLTHYVLLADFLSDGACACQQMNEPFQGGEPRKWVGQPVFNSPELDMTVLFLFTHLVDPAISRWLASTGPSSQSTANSGVQELPGLQSPALCCRQSKHFQFGWGVCTMAKVSYFLTSMSVQLNSGFLPYACNTIQMFHKSHLFYKHPFSIICWLCEC